MKALPAAGIARLWWGVGALACLAMAAFAYHGTMRNRGLLLDFSNFYDAGRKAAAGQFADLYDAFADIGGAPPLGNMSFVSAPISSYLYAPLADLPPAQAAFLFKSLVSLCLLAALAILYLYLARARATGAGRARFFGIFAVAALIFMPFWTIYWVGGQTTPVVLLLWVVAMVLHAGGAVLLPAIALTCALAIKPFLAPGLLFILLAAENRMRIALIGVGAATALISLLLIGPGPHLGFVERILLESSQLQEPYFNSNLFAWIEPLYLSPAEIGTTKELPGALKLLTTLPRLAAIALLAWLYVRFLNREDAPELRRPLVIVLGALVALIATPVAWAHYLALLFVPLMAIVSCFGAFPATARALTLTALALAFFQHFYFVRTFIEMGGPDDRTGLILVALVKSLPMLLTFVVVAVWFDRFARALSPATCADA